ncbi:rRNA maturation RNase YbeY [Fictibacillus aquaticus]|uniref:Endoribonuclease YbeY n=1 Tax=Fictibacillus aquaticus TaxID=2021314 RepID=A0A235FAH3_9BACL|nr:rRNA maturation RNase YbeY [Fictibacillus aquaticus]OYD57953.1 rRNA maturation RNase YbeY [Fictibacillus aquaticus]
MILHIDFLDETDKLTDKDKEFISTVLEKAAVIENTGAAEVSVTFVTRERIQEINSEYRGKDKPTDVISFAMEEGDEELHIKGADLQRMLGDIIICHDVAKDQAEDYGHSIDRELGFLAVHGFLHLLGYDHMTDEEEKIMFSRQEEILSSLKLER